MSSTSLPPVRAGRPAPDDLLERRAFVLTIPQNLEPGVTTEWTTLGGVATLRCAPEDGSSAGTILYLHGGGYRLGTPAGWEAWGTRLVNATGCTVLLPDYHLAPEHPFPQALHDVDACLDELAAAGASPLIVGGDSAGGGLALAIAVARSTPPDGLILISPWVDKRVTSGSYDTRASTDQLFSRDSATEAGEQYLQGHDPTDPLVSPLLADLSGLPPTLVFVGSAEVLLDDSLELTRALSAADVSVDLHVEAGQQHTWMTIFPDLDASRRALDTIAAYTRRVIA